MGAHAKREIVPRRAREGNGHGYRANIVDVHVGPLAEKIG